MIGGPRLPTKEIIAKEKERLNKTDEKTAYFYEKKGSRNVIFTPLLSSLSAPPAAAAG